MTDLKGQKRIEVRYRTTTISQTYTQTPRNPSIDTWNIRTAVTEGGGGGLLIGGRTDTFGGLYTRAAETTGLFGGRFVSQGYKYCGFGNHSIGSYDVMWRRTVPIERTSNSSHTCPLLKMLTLYSISLYSICSGVSGYHDCQSSLMDRCSSELEIRFLSFPIPRMYSGLDPRLRTSLFTNPKTSDGAVKRFCQSMSETYNIRIMISLQF